MNRKEQDKVLDGENWLIVQGYNLVKFYGETVNHTFTINGVINLLNTYKDYIYKVYHIGEKNKKYYKK